MTGTSWATVAQIGLDFIGSRMESRAETKVAEEKARMQAYMNTMRALSSAGNQNTIAANETFAVQESALVAVNIQKNAIRSKGAAKVQAAAAGVEGSSVTDTIRDIARNAATAEQTRRMALKAQLIGFDNQRENDVRAANAGMGINVFSGGSSMFESLLGSAGQAHTAYKDGAFSGGFGLSRKSSSSGFDYGNDGL